MSNGGSEPNSIAKWLFLDRKTGEIVIGQVPNAAALILGVSSLCLLIFRPTGLPGHLVGLAAICALLWWSITEIATGVNPFRRILGGAALLIAAFTYVAQLIAS